MSTNNQRLSMKKDASTDSALFLLNSKLYRQCYIEMREASTFEEMNSIYSIWAEILTLAKKLGIMHSNFEQSFSTLMGWIYDRGLELYWNEKSWKEESESPEELHDYLDKLVERQAFIDGE